MFPNIYRTILLKLYEIFVRFPITEKAIFQNWYRKFLGNFIKMPKTVRLWA